MRTHSSPSAFGGHLAAGSFSTAAADALASPKREWTISEMAQDFGLTLRALRFYEARGLIAPQRFGGARYYSARDRARVTLILTAKQLGFTLSETADMIGKSGEDGAGDLALSAETVIEQIDFLLSQRTAIDSALSALKQRLERMHATGA